VRAAEEGPIEALAAERLLARFVPGAGSGVLAVVFSQIRVPAGKFGLARLFARTRHACLFLNDVAGGWYLGLADAIDGRLDALGPRFDRVVYYGASMGGSGALAAGLRRGDGEVLAFGPDGRIGAPGTQSAAAGLAEAREDALAPLRPGHAREVTLVYGGFDPADGFAFTAAARREHPLLRPVLVRSGHEVHDHLYSVNVIRRVIQTFTRPIAAEIAAKALAMAADPAALRAFHAAVTGRADGDAIAALAPRLPGHPGVPFAAAERFAAAGRTDEAVARLEAAWAMVEGDPALRTLPKRYRKRYAARLLDLYAASGKTAKAAALLATCEADFGGDPR